MLERRTRGRGACARPGVAAALARAAIALGLRLWTKAARRPIDSIAIFGACAASLVVIVNAVFLQTAPHPAPFVANPRALPQVPGSPPKVAVTAAPKPVQSLTAGSLVGQRMPQAVSARPHAPIGELISSSVGSPSQVMTVQRILSEFGYGQFKPSGFLDKATSAAIEKFESEHKLPVTGRLSDRLLNELSAMTGQTIE